MKSISVAIPSSAMEDSVSLWEKTQKISEFARAFSIFRVNTIHVYQDSKKSEKDSKFLFKILSYLETPPYLRKLIFPKIPELKYVGILSPLKIPSHLSLKKPSEIKTGEIREGLVLSRKGKKFVDAGLSILFPYFGKKNQGNRILVKIQGKMGDFHVKEVVREDLTTYWSYKIKNEGKLHNLISGWEGEVILTSRKGRIISKKDLSYYSKTQNKILVVFGSPLRGIPDILLGKIPGKKEVKMLNFFPSQGTETVRLEEAILGTLSILNLGESLKF